jgi:integrase
MNLSRFREENGYGPLHPHRTHQRYIVKKLKKPCHAFRVLYATRRHQHGVDMETLRQELGHSDITTTQIYLCSADGHRSRINEADRFSMIPAPKAFLRRAAVA